jgi:hypothetical protein
VAVVVAQGLRHSVGLANLPALLKTIRGLHQYAASTQAAVDTPHTREMRVREGFEHMVHLLGLDLPDDVVRVLREDFVTRV